MKKITTILLLCLISSICFSQKYKADIFSTEDQYLLFNGISGKQFYMTRDLVQTLDSIKVNDKGVDLKSYSLICLDVENVDLGKVPRTLKKVYEFQSNSNKLTDKMKSALWNDPHISTLIFKNFVIIFNKTGKKFEYIFKEIRIDIIETSNK